jgi:hypothetical protein
MPPISVSNPRQHLDGILLKAVFPTGEVADFFATPYDTEEYGRALYQAAISGDFGVVENYVAPGLTEAQLLDNFIVEAMLALEKSDITVLRCYESGISVPVAWVIFRDQLRDIVSRRNVDYASGVPATPDYPDK